MQTSWCPDIKDYTNFYQLGLEHILLQNQNMENENENANSITKQLAKLTLLYDIPFPYLIPYEEMLQEHDIRFFYLDPNWVRCLLDGACSLGRSASSDYSHDAVFIENLYRNAVTGNLNIRRALLHKEPVFKKFSELPACTGFLLRSPLVGEWRGLEFDVFADQDGTSKLTLLRLESLAPDILIGMVDGILRRVDIKEPAESFHYGFREEEDGTFTKQLRSIADGKLFPSENASVTVFTKNNRVIDFAKTAEAMRENPYLFPKGASKEDFTSAHMALEMIQNPFTLRITENK